MLGKVFSAARAMAGEAPKIGASAHESIDGAIGDVFEVGTSRQIIPTEAGRMRLQLASQEGQLERGEAIGVSIDLQDLGRAADVLMNITGRSTLDLQMRIQEYNQQRVFLRGALQKLGHSTLAISLRDLQDITTASIDLAVFIESPILRPVVATQQKEINTLLQADANTFIAKYKENIEAGLLGEQTAASA